jgi:hypothetical protein
MGTGVRNRTRVAQCPMNLPHSGDVTAGEVAHLTVRHGAIDDKRATPAP